MKQMTDIIKQNIVLARDKVWASPKLQELLSDEISCRVDVKNN